MRKTLKKAIARVASALWTATKWVGRASLVAAVALSPWVLGVIALAGPFVLLETVAPSDVAPWSVAYVAGATGGLILELIRSRWMLELPSHVAKRARGADEFAPAGPRIDIGFFGRLTTSAVAAPTFLIIVNALDNTDPAGGIGPFLAGVADRPDTIAWAVLLGAVSPMVWKAGENFVKTRFAIADTQLETQLEIAKVAKKSAEEKAEKARQSAKDAVKKSRTPHRTVVAEPTARPKGKTGGRRAAGQKVLGVHASGNGDASEALDSGNGELADALVEYDGALSEAIGALSVATAVGNVRERRRRQR